MAFTIVGGGLAGCTLAWALLERGCRVRVFDRRDPASATRVAAGIINPITGPNLTLSWRFAELWPVACEFYARVEEQSGASLFSQLPLTRLLHSEEQARKWGKRLGQPGYREWIDAEFEAPPGCDSAFGGFSTPHAGHLNTVAYIEATQARLGGDWHEAEYKHDSSRDSTVIYCEGIAARSNPYFEWVPFKPAKGETLEILCDGLPADRIINRGGVWTLPMAEGRFRAGATYDWDACDSEPTAAGRGEIEGRLKRLLQLPFVVVGHRAGIRPVIRASKLLMGMHPAQERTGFFNGLGSKGVLTAPLFAGQLAEYLLGDGSIDPEVDLRQNF